MVGYALPLPTPLLGLALIWTQGQELSLFGLVQLPPLLAADPDLADILATCHRFVAWSLLTVARAHAAAWTPSRQVLNALIAQPLCTRWRPFFSLMVRNSGQPH
jgi:cytochrome b561